MKKKIEESSIGLIATDPPYGIEFMDKEWDEFKVKDHERFGWKGEEGEQDLKVKKNFEVLPRFFKDDFRVYQKWTEKWGRQALRVLKPGGLMFVMGHTTTYHRMACGVEDAGFQVMDMIEWIYWSGYWFSIRGLTDIPKAYNISQGFDKRECLERFKHEFGRSPTKEEWKETWNEFRKIIGKHKTHRNRQNLLKDMLTLTDPMIREPTTELAKKWDGWKSARGLKPAHEPILLCQKPFEGSIIDNVKEHGVGGINVDESRIPYLNESDKWVNDRDREKTFNATFLNMPQKGMDSSKEGGRFPANLIASPNVDATRIPFENQNDKPSSGISGGSAGLGEKIKGHKFIPSNIGRYSTNLLSLPRILGDNTRMVDIDAWAKKKFGFTHWKFADVPKPSKDEKNRGLKEKRKEWTKHGHVPVGENLKKAPKVGNFHPTVKPVKLFLYLLSLGCPPDEIILDPFGGSGTTLIAAKMLGLKGIMIEKSREYMNIAIARVKATPSTKRLV